MTRRHALSSQTLYHFINQSINQPNQTKPNQTRNPQPQKSSKHPSTHPRHIHQKRITTSLWFPLRILDSNIAGGRKKKRSTRHDAARWIRRSWRRALEDDRAKMHVYFLGRKEGRGIWFFVSFVFVVFFGGGEGRAGRGGRGMSEWGPRSFKLTQYMYLIGVCVTWHCYEPSRLLDQKRFRWSSCKKKSVFEENRYPAMEIDPALGVLLDFMYGYL